FIPDLVRYDCPVLFVGINPSDKAPFRTKNHFFGGRGNCFWTCFSNSGLLREQYDATADKTVFDRYNVGFVNLVPRPTTTSKQLEADEIAEGVRHTTNKIKRFRPKVVCCVGKIVFQ
ncbi:uracil-DNA glycosylase-like protein, partial [Radiomyces spectabilis]|uniref:uracil-DNA glycosylase-like protein n=1 Tax=Radiomyces spectabilis TaxID=64574 RepID=UPI00221F128D